LTDYQGWTTSQGSNGGFQPSPTMWPRKVLPRHQTVGPKRRPRPRDMQGFDRARNTAWFYLSTVSKKTCVKMQSVHGHRGDAGRPKRLPGAKKRPRSRLFRGLSKIPASGQPLKGEGSLPCTLFPSDFLCQALRKSTCAKLMVLKVPTRDRINTRPNGDGLSQWLQR
jgi:hypothetical protein